MNIADAHHIGDRAKTRWGSHAKPQTREALNTKATERESSSGARLSAAGTLLAWQASALCLAVAFTYRDAIGLGFFLLLAAGASVIGFWWLAHVPSEASPEEQELHQFRTELDDTALRLERRERELAERLATFHEWMEFPEPILIGDPVEVREEALSAEQCADLANQDRQLMELLEEETEALFDRIRDNTYTIDGRLDLSAAYQDALSLVRRVARIYQSDAEEPLLETSLSLIMRSVSRAALQLLVVLEQLPLDVKDLSISRLYGYVRTAVQAYGVYKVARPYLPWLTNAYYFGRYALGTNPLTLGAWYATGTLGKKAAQSAASRLVDQHALQLIQNIVRLIGYEVAQTYSGDFRRRDPHWIYAAELSTLVSKLPASARTLSAALSEIGALQLRSEYDRVWFYRCLAAGMPGSVVKQAAHLMSARERVMIARRLERFIDPLSAAIVDTLEDWRCEAEERLGTRIGDASPKGGEANADEALRSLAGFLLEIKQLEVGQLESALLATSAGLAAPAVVESLSADPSFLFEYPELPPGGPAAQSYLFDLVKLGVVHPGRGRGMLHLLEEVAAYLRIDCDAVAAQWQEELLNHLRRRISSDHLRGEPAAALVALALDLLEDASEPHCVFWPARLDATETGPPLILVAADGQLTAWRTGDEEPSWQAPFKDARAERERSMLVNRCRVHADGQPVLVIEGAVWTRYQRYFSPLLQVLPD